MCGWLARVHRKCAGTERINRIGTLAYVQQLSQRLAFTIKPATASPRNQRNITYLRMNPILSSLHSTSFSSLLLVFQAGQLFRSHAASAVRLCTGYAPLL